MKNLKPFQHSESFDYLAEGNQILTRAIDNRNEALSLVKDILEKVDKLNSLHETYCPISESGKKDLELAFKLGDSRFYGSDNHKLFNEVKKDIDTRFWNDVVNNSGITSVMHSKMKEDFKTSISEKTPEFDHENVFGTLSYYTDNRMTVYVEGIINLFKSLDNNFKTNDGIRFRKKIIFNNIFGNYGFCNYGRGSEQIQDLERIFLVMDGIDPSRISFDKWATRRIEKAGRGEETQYEYFKVKTFLNGNVHLWLTREDLTKE